MSPSAVTPTSKGFPGLLDIVQGFGNPLQKTFTYSIGGTPVNLTGFTASLSITSNDVEIIAATSGAGITLGGTAGTVAVDLDSTEMDAATPGIYKWTIRLIPSAERDFAFMAGELRITDV